MLLHDPDEAPLVRDLAFALAPGSHNLLAVTYNKVQTCNDQCDHKTLVVLPSVKTDKIWEVPSDFYEFYATAHTTLHYITP